LAEIRVDVTPAQIHLVGVLGKAVGFAVASPSKGPDRNRSKSKPASRRFVSANAKRAWVEQTAGDVRLLLPLRQSRGIS